MLDSFGINGPMTTAPERAEGVGLSVRPEVFLYPPWRGNGLVCDGFGLPRERYRLRGKGRTEPDSTVVIEHRAEFETGATSAYDWVFAPTDGQLIRARDRLNGVEARGGMTPAGFRWSFRTVGQKGLMARHAKVEIDYRMLSAHEAETTITLSAFGVTFGTGTSHIHHDR